MDPRLFEEIRAKVKEGRWEVVNGWIVQPDCNVPSTESFVRQSLYGKAYFARELGVDVKTGYNVDSFGHAGGLPQILARAGFDDYVFMRPHPHECDLPRLFWWEGPDRSRVLTWRVGETYCQGPAESPDEFGARIRRSAETDVAPGFDDGCYFLGVGNHGGGPTKRQIAKVLELREELRKEFREDGSLPEISFSTLGAFFDALRQSPKIGDIPVIATELQHHATGCYSAMGEVKRLNRRAERSLVRAETLAVMSGPEEEAPYPADELKEAWWKVLFNQFHDILAGSSIEPAYRDARDSLGSACETADRVTVGSVHALARRVDTSDAPSGVLFLANPLPWRRNALVRIDMFTAPDRENEVTHLETREGERIPIQWATPEAVVGPEWRKLAATVELPPSGYRAFHLATGAAPETPEWKADVEVNEGAMGVASLKTPDGTELLTRPVGLVVIEDKSDSWGHGVDEYRKEIGRPKLSSSRVVEDGPVLHAVRQKASWGKSEIMLDVITYREIDAVELRFTINWQERHQILKLEIPTALSEVRSFAKTAGGVTERRPTGGEEPCQDWVALAGLVDGERRSLGLVNDGIYSYDCLDGLLRTVLVRSAAFAHHDPAKLPSDPDVPYLDQGRQERRLWLVAGEGGHAQLNLHRRAEELQTPAEYAVDSRHPGTEPWERSFIEVAPESVAVSAIKRAEDGRGTIIRLQEMRGEEVEARVLILGLGLDWKGRLGPWEIRTLRVARNADGGAEVVETDLLERPVERDW